MTTGRSIGHDPVTTQLDVLWCADAPLVSRLAVKLRNEPKLRGEAPSEGNRRDGRERGDRMAPRRCAGWPTIHLLSQVVLGPDYQGVNTLG